MATKNKAVKKSSTAAERIREMAQHAEVMKNDADQDVSTLFTAYPDTFPQGDVYVTLLSNDPEAKLESLSMLGRTEFEEITPVAKLAPGEGQGSRHELGSLDGVVMYRRKSGAECDGPVLRLKSVNSIVHPEHGNLVNIQPGVYAISYQQTGDQIRRRVRD